MNNIIEVDRLTKSFKQYKKKPGLVGSLSGLFKREYFDIEAVSDVTFSIKPGEAVGFIGPNGAGKTTTLKMLSGLLYPTSGIATVMGFQPFQRKNEFLKQCSLVMGQKSQLWWDLPAREGFLLNKEIYEIDSNTYKNTVKELADMLDVEAVLDVPVRKLSLGQRMKCELMASLLHGPKVLFLDEPTIGLDVVVQKRVREFLKLYNKQKGVTLMLTSHYMDDVRQLCDRVIVINKGRVLFDGDLEKMIRDYAEDKYLKMVFNEKVYKKDLVGFGRVVSINSDGLSATLAVPRDKHTKIAGEMLNTLPVDDLDISEVDLEEVISEMFKA